MGWLFNRKEKKQQDMFFQLLGDALKAANENVQTVGKAIYDRQEPDRNDFGLCETNPIFTTSLAGTEDYLGRLCTKDGSKFTWSSYSSVSATVHGHADVSEDMYTLYLNGEKYTDIYVVPYVGESKFPPAGLYFSNDDTDWDLEREAYGKGITGAQLIEIRRMEEESKREKQRVQKELEETISKKAAHIGEKYTDFSIEAELQNPDFVFLAKFDIDVLSVYEYCHREKLLFKRVTTQNTNFEIPNSEYYLNILHNIENKERQQILREDRDRLNQRFQSNHIPREDVLVIQRMEKDNAELKWKMRVKELKTFAKQAVEVQTLYHNFNLCSEWKSETFRKITSRYDMRAAYEVIHFNECYSQETADESSSIAECESEQKTTCNEEKLFCRKCGIQLPLDSLFCNRCGTKVETFN